MYPYILPPYRGDGGNPLRGVANVAVNAGHRTTPIVYSGSRVPTPGPVDPLHGPVSLCYTGILHNSRYYGGGNHGGHNPEFLRSRYRRGRTMSTVGDSSDAY